MDDFFVNFSDAERMHVSLSEGDDFSVTMDDVPVQPRYVGPYSFTPTDTEQVIEIAGLTAAHDITVEAIPSNYGLITWNGSVLTVS